MIRADIEGVGDSKRKSAVEVTPEVETLMARSHWSRIRNREVDSRVFNRKAAGIAGLGTALPTVSGPISISYFGEQQSG